jgi:hypothetical protein
LKTAGRKAMQVRVLSPPPFSFNDYSHRRRWLFLPTDKTKASPTRPNPEYGTALKCHSDF